MLYSINLFELPKDDLWEPKVVQILAYEDRAIEQEGRGSVTSCHRLKLTTDATRNVADCLRRSLVVTAEQITEQSALLTA